MDIVSRIKKLAKEKNLTLAEIGQTTGIGETAIYRWDVSKPNVYNVAKVAKLLDVTIEFLLYGKNENECSCIDSNIETF